MGPYHCAPGTTILLLKLHPKFNPVRFTYNICFLTGYANEVGEAFRSMIPKSLVLSSYAVASLYAVSDASDKAYKSFKVWQHSSSTPERVSQFQQGIESNLPHLEQMVSCILPNSMQILKIGYNRGMLGQCIGRVMPALLFEMLSTNFALVAKHCHSNQKMSVVGLELMLLFCW